MSPEQNVAYLQAQITCAQIEMVAMQTANTQAIMDDKPLVYSYDDFMNLINQYSIHHNQAIELLRY